MPLPLTVSCFSKIQIGFTFLVPAHLGSPGHRAVKRVCVCVCARACLAPFLQMWHTKCIGTDIFEVYNSEMYPFSSKCHLKVRVRRLNTRCQSETFFTFLWFSGNFFSKRVKNFKLKFWLPTVCSYIRKIEKFYLILSNFDKIMPY